MANKITKPNRLVIILISLFGIIGLIALVGFVMFGLSSVAKYVKPVGSVVESSRRIVYTNSQMREGVTCGHVLLEPNGKMTDRYVDGKTIPRLPEGQQSNYLKIDADVEVQIQECSAVVPNPEPRKEEVIVIKKVYSVEPAGFDDISF